MGAGVDGGKERRGEFLQLGGADTVDLGELLSGAWPPTYHVDQGAIVEHDIGRYTALFGQFQP